MEEKPFSLALSIAIEAWGLTGPARPDLRWQCVSWSSIRSGQGPAESQTQQELPADAYGLSVGSLECIDTNS